jgi:L-2,4-diaminobutyric acid acetyltransferase
MHLLDIGSDSAERHASAGTVLRPPLVGDGPRVHSLVASCPPLDVNSTYAYLLVCIHFAATSIVAERGGAMVGFVSAYLEPDDPAALFVWQVAVAPAARGAGLGGAMLDRLLARPACGAVRFIETTIGPSNEASWRLFTSLARRRRVDLERSPFFAPDAFGMERHEAETLARIGPFDGSRGGS